MYIGRYWDGTESDFFSTHLFDSEHGAILDIPGQKAGTECPRTNKFPLNPMFPLKVGGMATTISALEKKNCVVDIYLLR